MPYEFRQWRNHALASDAILEVIPEVDPQLPAGFLQARKRVSATPSGVTAGTATDFPFLDVVAQGILAAVVMQGHLRPSQNAKQLLLVLSHLLEYAVDARKARALGTQVVETRFPLGRRRRFRLLAVGLETLVQLPDSLPGLVNGQAVRFAEPNHPGQGTLLINPTN